jgi:hypothetical protein
VLTPTTAHYAVFLLPSLYVDHCPILVLGSTIGAELQASAVLRSWQAAINGGQRGFVILPRIRAAMICPNTCAL